MNLNSNKFEFHQLNDQNLVRVYLTLAEGSNQTGNREEANNRWKGGRKSAEKKRFVGSARLSFEGEIDSRWWRWVPGANPLPLRPFYPFILASHRRRPPSGIYLFSCGSNAAGCLCCFSTCLEQEGEENIERKGEEDGWRVDFEGGEAKERERGKDGEPRAIHGGLVKSAGETRNP